MQRLRTELGTTGRVASKATAKCDAALARFEMTAAEAENQCQSLRDGIETLDEQVQSCEARQAAECREVRESVDAAIAKVEEAVASRLEKLDDMGMSQGAKLSRVLSVVDEWETAASEGAAAAQAADRRAGAAPAGRDRPVGAERGDHGSGLCARRRGRR